MELSLEGQNQGADRAAWPGLLQLSQWVLPGLASPNRDKGCPHYSAIHVSLML